MPAEPNGPAGPGHRSPKKGHRGTSGSLNEGRADYVPIFLSDVSELFTSGVLALDAVLLNVSAADAHGYCSLGTSVATALRLP